MLILAFRPFCIKILCIFFNKYSPSLLLFSTILSFCSMSKALNATAAAVTALKLRVAKETIKKELNAIIGKKIVGVIVNNAKVIREPKKEKFINCLFPKIS